MEKIYLFYIKIVANNKAIRNKIIFSSNFSPLRGDENVPPFPPGAPKNTYIVCNIVTVYIDEYCICCNCHSHVLQFKQMSDVVYQNHVVFCCNLEVASTVVLAPLHIRRFVKVRYMWFFKLRLIIVLMAYHAARNPSQAQWKLMSEISEMLLYNCIFHIFNSSSAPVCI